MIKCLRRNRNNSILRHNRVKHNTIISVQNTNFCVLLQYVPSALGVTGDVVFEAVLLYLQRVIEGSIQLLHSHLNWTLQGNRQSHVLKKSQCNVQPLTDTTQ